MALPSFSAFHDEGINLEGLLEILNPENNLVLADDMMVSDGNGIILRVSETYEKNFGFAHNSIVGRSAFDLEADGTFTPCITAEVIRQKKKISATQTINHTHKNVMTVGIPLFDANGELKYAVCFNTVSMEQINSIQQDLPPHDSPGRVGHQLKHRQRTDAFSRCALSHHGHTFSPAYRIGETVYGPQHFAVHIEISL